MTTEPGPESARASAATPEPSGDSSRGAPPSARRARAADPPSTSGTKALIGILLAGTAGLIVLLFVHLSQDGRIHPGLAAAHAECTQDQVCLPDVNYTDTTGVAYSHSSLAGKVVLVNFWATWCHPCQVEIPDLSRVYDKYKSQGVVFLGVMTDNPDNGQLLNFQSDYSMTYPVVRASSDVMLSFNYPEQLPTTFIYDRHGKQIVRRVGVLGERELDSLIGQLAARN
jgi:thiol-disulfide isomerase/thioredoxin